MAWLMEILKIWLEEQLLIKYCIIKHLILLQMRNMFYIKNPKYDVYQQVLASMVYKYFDKKTSGDAATLAWSEILGSWATRNISTVKNENMSNNKLAAELHKPIVRKFKKKKSTLIFYRQCLGCWFYRYANNK